MSKTKALPATLHEAIRYFSDKDTALTFLASLRWPNGVTCPACEAKDPGFLKTRRIWKCRKCGRQFSVKLGTIFEDSPIGLDKWLPAVWMLVNDKNGISSYEVARALGVTQKTGWFMLHRIRLAMQRGGIVIKMRGEVEADETFIGGAARFMHRVRREQKIKGRGMVGKTAVMGLLERHGPDKVSRVKVSVVPTVRRHHLQAEIRQHVEPGTQLYTDALKSYERLTDLYTHHVIDHAEAYAHGRIHTNGLENFWSLLKRAIKGTYVSVEPFHLFRYLDEQALRFNERARNDGGRFVEVLRTIVGRRLTYRGLIGNALATT